MTLHQDRTDADGSTFVEDMNDNDPSRYHPTDEDCTTKCGTCGAPMKDADMLRRHFVDVHVFEGAKGVRDEYHP